MDKATVLRSMMCLGLVTGFVPACSDDGAPGGGGPGPDGSVADGSDAGAGGDDAGIEDADRPPCQLAVTQGRLNGKRVESTCHFLGVPYAKPPLGALRFAPPQAAGNWDGVRDATMFGPSCMQKASILGDATATSEDCLSLNVYTPDPAPAAKLPVMVFIHGGGYTLGGSSTYDGRLLSQKGPVVVVTINYRLGAFAFFAHPELDRERAGAPSGSDGIRDQQLALRWVKDNIAAFQGDPNNVTVFGESAGSFSATILLVSPLSRDLAHRFILESGASVGGGFGTTSRETGYALSTAMASGLCASAPDVVACLRGTPAQQLVDWTGGTMDFFGAPWAPVIEGTMGAVLPDAPQNLIASNDYNRAAAIIAGSNKNEWGLFIQPVLGGMPVTTVAQFKASVAQQFGARAPEVEAQYPVGSDGSQRRVHPAGHRPGLSLPYANARATHDGSRQQGLSLLLRRRSGVPRRRACLRVRNARVHRNGSLAGARGLRARVLDALRRNRRSQLVRAARLADVRQCDRSAHRAEDSAIRGKRASQERLRLLGPIRALGTTLSDLAPRSVSGGAKN